MGAVIYSPDGQILATATNRRETDRDPAIMVDGTGMCGACRIMVGGEVKFACVDGPEFDGHLVDFDLAMERQRTYKTEEGRALLRYREGLSYSGKSSGKECGGDK